MKPLVINCAAWLLVAGPAMLGAQNTAQAEKLLESARHKDVMEGDLKAAIEQYRKVAAQFAKQPEIAARALFQLGQCQEKLGQAEARKSYERIVREYSGAQQYASAARARLAALGGGGSAGQQATRVVWTGPKVDGNESSVSPDGRFISFPDWETGNLGLHDVATGADRLLTNTGTWKPGEVAYAEVSAISRDGKQVAYAWFDKKIDQYELRVVNVNGDPNPRRVFGNPNLGYIEPRDWSPDGKSIAVYLEYSRISPNEPKRQLCLIGTQDGSVRVLKSETDDLGTIGFSSDGKHIFYTRGRHGGVSRGYLISADGKSEVPLLSGLNSVESPVWTPDGSRIVFVSDRSGSPGLWSIGVADGKPQGEPELLKADFGNATVMGFARNGSLFYEMKLEHKDIYLAGLDPATGKLTSELKRVNERAIGNSWGRVAWLPDGKSLSFWNGRPVDTLVLSTLSTSEEREIWRGSGRSGGSGYTGWFPDGRSLMFWQINGQARIFRRVDSSTGEVHATWTIPNLPSGSTIHAFSPDLMTMFFSRKDQTLPCEGTKCTYIMLARALETGRDREVFRINAATVRSAPVSPNGREMAITASDGNGEWSVMVAPTAGGTPRELYRGRDAGIGHATWTHDGDHVLAFRMWLGGRELWSYPTKGGSPEKSPLPIRLSSEPAVSPDGTQIAFAGGNTKSEIWVMTGLLQDAKPAAPR